MPQGFVKPALSRVLGNRPNFTALVMLCVGAVVLFLPLSLRDADTWWHMAAGQWMMAHHTVPMTDPFTRSVAGHPWLDHEWLAEVVLAAAYALAGYLGLTLLTAAAVALAMGCIARRLSQCVALPVCVLVCSLAFVCMIPQILARPHILVLPILTWWSSLLLRAMDDNTPPPLWTALALVPWCNMHGSFVLGGIMALGCAVVQVARQHTLANAGRWAVFLLLCLVAVCINPSGVHGAFFPLDHLLHPMRYQGVREWLPPDFSRLQPIEVALLVLLYASLTRSIVLSRSAALAVVCLGYEAITHQRHELVAGAVGPFLLLPALGRSFPSVSQGGAVQGGRSVWLRVCGVLVLALGVLGLRVRFPLPVSPVGGAEVALQHVPPALQAQPVFNDDTLGGYLIFRHIPPLLDGRAELFPQAFRLSMFDALLGHDADFNTIAHQYAVCWTFAAPAWPLNAHLAQDPAWERLYTDHFATVYARKACLPAPTQQGADTPTP